MRIIKTHYVVGNTVIERPKCTTPGCKNYAQNMGNPNSLGHPTFRQYCINCHNARRVVFREKIALTDRRSAPCCAAPSCRKKTSITGTTRKGELKFTTYCPDHVGLASAHLAFRKTYCENIDSRFGFTCTTTIMLMAQLEVDHIDGNPYNNDPANLQTLCSCCHKYKTITNRDYATPGRKKLKKG